MERHWKVLIVTSVAVFMSFLDVTIVNVAFPDVERDFPDASRADLSWILNGYNIVFAALLVVACLRQIGAVLGIATLVAVLEAAPAGDPLEGFTDAWTLMAVTAAAVALLALALGRVRAGAPAVASAEASA